MGAEVQLKSADAGATQSWEAVQHHSMVVEHDIRCAFVTVGCCQQHAEFCCHNPQAQFGGEIEAESSVFGGEDGAKRLADLKTRIIEHNVLVISLYYTRITTARLAELLDLAPGEEAHDALVCYMHGVRAIEAWGRMW